MEPEDHEETGEGSCGEIGGELVLSAGIKQSSIPGFSQEQVNGINGVLAQMTAMMDAKLEAQNRQFQASYSSLLAAIQQLSQPANQIGPPSTSSQQLQQSNPITSIEPPQQRQSTPPQPISTPPA